MDPIYFGIRLRIVLDNNYSNSYDHGYYYYYYYIYIYTHGWKKLFIVRLLERDGQKMDGRKIKLKFYLFIIRSIDILHSFQIISRFDFFVTSILLCI